MCLWLLADHSSDDMESLLGDPIIVSFRDGVKPFPEFASRMGHRIGWTTMQLFLEVWSLQRL